MLTIFSNCKSDDWGCRNDKSNDINDLANSFGRSYMHTPRYRLGNELRLQAYLIITQ